MSTTISLLDANCVRMGRLAALVAEAQQLLGTEDIMDIFKRSLFDGALDAPPFQAGETRNDPSNWLHMEIEAPRCSLPPNQAALKVRPKQLYGVGRSTVASVLLTTNALPGDPHPERYSFITRVRSGFGPLPNVPPPEIRFFRLLQTSAGWLRRAFEQRSRRFIADRAMWSYLVIVSTPTLKLFSGIRQR